VELLWRRFGTNGRGHTDQRSVAHRLLIEAERTRGDEGAALRAYSRCVDILRTELGVTPSPGTLELAYDIRTVD
jgi:DNA-binding SARP family transcriptional activator